MRTFSCDLPKAVRGVILGLTAACFAFGQYSDQASGGWRRIPDVQAQQQLPPQQTPQQSAPQQAPLPEWQGDGPDAPAQGPAPAAGQAPAQALSQNSVRTMPPPPDALTIRPGTFLTVRIDQPLSSDRSQPGDVFSTTLVKPVVVDGVVVAYPGQTVEGQVTEAQKAGRAGGNASRLGVQLTSLSLADGTQVPVHSQLIARSGGSNAGRDVGVIAGTTATGATIGAIANGGYGAGIGAAIGAAAGTVGVLLTRGQPTIVPAESVLTFRVDAPVTVVTARAPQAFRYVEPADYDRPPAPLQPQQVAQPRPSMCGPYGCGAPYYGAPYWGPSVYWGAYWGPSVWVGRGFYRGYYRGGYHRGGYYRAYRGYHH